MKNNKSIFILSVFMAMMIFSPVLGAEDDDKKGLLTDSDDLGALGLGLEVAEAMMSEDGAVEGLKGLGESKLDDWMWDSLGGYEKLYTGQLDITDPYIKQIKDKFDLIQETIEKVQTCAEKLGAGQYDEALVTAIDFAVGQVDHPAVSIMWTAIKYAYESHKLVQESGAELQIEALYGKVEGDRKLVGTIDAKADQPALIPETSEMADYFFEKYVVTDVQTRDMVKAYVTGVLGDEWPEQSWGEWFDSWRALGSGEDTARSAETEALSTEFRNKARTWIMRLIKDVNLEVKTRWAEARARQELIAFQQFVQKHKAFTNNIPSLLREFQGKKKYRAELPKFKEYLTQSPAALQAAKNLAAKGKNIREVQQAIETWKSNLVRGYSSCALIGEKALSDQLKQELRNWWAFEKEFKQILEKQQETMVQKPEEAIPENSGLEVTVGEKEFYMRVFAPLLVPFKEWPETPEAIVGIVQDLVNQGNFMEARQAHSDWDSKANNALYEYYNKAMSGKLEKALEDAKKPFLEKIDTLQKESSQLSTDMAALQRRIDAAAVTDDASLKQSLGQEMTNKWKRQQSITEQVRALGEEIGELTNAYSIAREVSYALDGASGAIKIQTDREIVAMMGVFERLQQARTNQWNVYLNQVYEAIRNIPLKILTGQGHDTYADEYCARYVQDIEDAIAQIKSKPYEGLGKFDSAETVFGLLYEMEQRISWSQWNPYDLSIATSSISALEIQFALWKAEVEKFKQIETPSDSELREMRILVGPDAFDARWAEIKRIETLPQALEKFMKRIRDRVDEMNRLLEENTTQRQEDAEWLRVRKLQLEKFLEDQVKNGLLKVADNNYELVVETDGDMMITTVPYKHYLMEPDVAAYADSIRQKWEPYPGYKFIKANAPKVNEWFEGQLRLPKVERATEENFFAPSGTAEIVIWASAVAKFESAITGVKHDASDHEFTQQMIDVTSALPGAVTGAGDGAGQVQYATDQSYKNNPAAFDHALGARYIAALEKLQKIFDDRETYLASQKTTGPSGPGTGPGQAGPGGVPGGAGGQGGPGGAPGQGGPGGQPPQAGPGGAPGQGGPGGQGVQGQGGGLGGPGGPGGQQGQGGPGGQQGQTGPSGARGQTLSRSAMTSFGTYQIEDPRVNTRDLRSASGDVVFTNSDLRNGAIEVTGRLNMFERIEKILVSNDGGRTWSELPLDSRIAYAFMPAPERLYQIVFKLKTIDLEEILLEPFKNINGFLYRNIDYNTLVVEAVKKISEAYETQNQSLFAQLISREYVGNRIFLEEGVRFDFDMFTDIRFQIFINRIEIRGNLFVAETKWNKTQVPRNTGQQQTTTGDTTMVFVLEDGQMKIQNLRGNLIYATLSPEVAESSGLSQTVVEDIRQAQQDRNPVQPGAGETQDSGGTVSSTPSATSNGTVVSAPADVNGFDFAAGTQTDQGVGDFDFEMGNMFMMNGTAEIKEVTGTYTFDSLTEAPLDGYSFGANVAAGDVFAFKTVGGYYGKCRITSLVNNPPIDDTVQFEYMVQTDGSRNLTT